MLVTGATANMAAPVLNRSPYAEGAGVAAPAHHCAGSGTRTTPERRKPAVPSSTSAWSAQSMWKETAWVYSNRMPRTACRR